MPTTLSGVRVIAVENAIAGPFGSMLLADLGAEVVKIEPPEGESARRLAGPGHKGELFYYLAFNRNKKSITLNLQTPTGKRAFYDLVGKSDVVWDNFRPGVMERLGADYQTLKKLNPRIITCSVSGYGSSGPYRDRPSFDLIVQAISGILSITGEPGGRPIKPGPPIADMVAGMFSALGVVAALFKRAETGEGQRIEVSLLDSCLSLLAYQLSFFFCSGIAPGPMGSGHLGMSPYGVFKTADRYIATGVAWPRIARTLGADWMIDDPRFSTLKGRVEHRDELTQAMEEQLSKATAEQWLELFEADDIPVGLVQDLAQAAVDPQLLHRNMIVSVEHPLGGKVGLTGNPIKMEGEEEEFTAPPTLGQHTEQVLTEVLGYSRDEMDKLKTEEEQYAEELKKHIHKLR